MNAEQFKQELKSLLAKYEVSIGFDCDDSSDTHGIYDGRIVVFDKRDKELFSAPGWSLSATDIL